MELPQNSEIPSHFERADTPEESRTLFIDDMPPCDQNLIKMIFRKCGQIEKVFIKKKINSQYCLAYVTFDNHESAKKGLNEVNYTKIRGKEFYLYWDDRETIEIRKNKANSIIITGLDNDIENKDLHDLFADFGDVIHCRIKSNEFGSFAIVQYRRNEDAAKVISELDGGTINDKPVEAKWYQQKAKSNGNKIFIKGIPGEKNSIEELTKVLSQFGKIVRIKPVRVGSSVVTFSTQQEAQKAINELRTKLFFGVNVVAEPAKSKREYSGGWGPNYQNQYQQYPLQTGPQQRGGYQNGYPPQQSQYPPHQGQYIPRQGQYPPQQGPYQPGYPQGYPGPAQYPPQAGYPQQDQYGGYGAGRGGYPRGGFRGQRGGYGYNRGRGGYNGGYGGRGGFNQGRVPYGPAHVSEGQPGQRGRRVQQNEPALPQQLDKPYIPPQRDADGQYEQEQANAAFGSTDPEDTLQDEQKLEAVQPKEDLIEDSKPPESQ